MDGDGKVLLWATGLALTMMEDLEWASDIEQVIYKSMEEAHNTHQMAHLSIMIKINM